MKKLILSTFALAAFVLVSNSVSAQTTALTVTLPTVMTLSVEEGVNLSTVFEASELTAGKELSGAVTLNYISNKRTFVSISANDFTATGGFIMPASIVQFRTSTDAAFDINSPKLTGTSQVLSGVKNIGGGEVGNARGNHNIVVSYLLTPGLDYEPADYSNLITYTITAN